MTGFLKETWRLNPLCPSMMPVRDLPLVLRALSEPPFELLRSAQLRVLSLKTVLLQALACGKRVGDL